MRIPKDAGQRVWLAGVVLAVALASLPSAQGVYGALSHTRLQEYAFFGAVALELAYIVSALTPSATSSKALARVASGLALTVAITLNVLFDYSVRVPDVLVSGQAASASFDVWLLILSFIETAPLSTLAFILALAGHSMLDGMLDADEQQQRAIEAMKEKGKEQCPHCGKWYKSGGSIKTHVRHCKG